MEVKVAKTAGFCFGVKRAVDLVYKEAEESPCKPVYTYGPIIHNEEVIADLEARGVRVIDTEKELDQIQTGTVIIRSHGVGKAIYDHIESRGLRLVDATCPFVKKIHRAVSEAGSRGDHVIIIGKADHPEVQGIIGWCSGTYNVIAAIEDAEKLSIPEGRKVTTVCQTTFNLVKYKKIIDYLTSIWYDVYVVKTICTATQERQTEAKEIASSVDAMIVIGGRTSSNTQKLYEICKSVCEDTCYIQTLRDLSTKTFQTGCTVVGITAGASTPEYIIEEVQLYVRTNF